LFGRHRSPPEGSQASGPLSICADDEITGSFDCFHCHFNWPPAFEEVDHNINAMSFIDALLIEKIGIMSWWQGDKLRVSTTFDAGMQDTLKAPRGSTRIRRRSWRGSLNEDASL
jgi:hypothetical protein